MRMNGEASGVEMRRTTVRTRDIAQRNPEYGPGYVLYWFSVNVTSS
jgi:hypothetical protein